VDRFGEFFVGEDGAIGDQDERFWKHKYTLRPAMLPRCVRVCVRARVCVCVLQRTTSFSSAPPLLLLLLPFIIRFIPRDLAHKILVIGKSIDFMRRCCQDREW
jgi:hypothetical protein